MENSPIPLEDSLPTVWPALRLVATDMDGTLTDRGHFTPGLLQSLADLAAAGLPTVIVTGRSAGWVQGVVAYLPIAGAIAENGGVFIPKATGEPTWLVEIPALDRHRVELATMFAQIRETYPRLQPSTDNPFRLTDWTFDLGDLTPADLQTLEQTCREAGWGFTYSSVQCHIRPIAQDKGVGLKTVLRQQYPDLSAHQVVTVGDSPNDAGLFDGRLFPISVGVANVQPYRDRLRDLPAFITHGEEVRGFQELVQKILQHRA